MNIIITGASRGIGFELVRLCSEDKNNRILALSRNSDLLNKLYENCNQSISIIPFDLEGNQNSFRNLAKIVKSQIDGIDILINNAGILINKPFTHQTNDDFSRQFNVNVRAPFTLMQVLLNQFRQGSHILNISSMGGFQGSSKYKGLSLYSASKGALAILTECMAEELKDYGVSINCLALGAVQTEMLAEAFPGYKAPKTPEEVAGFIKNFAFTGHHFFNGKILPVTLSNP
ncbi:MAG: SDR family NAD(P)-dependent oxidoreductase [Bacteroidales bacterium]|nr:SDR family NAD(P)-dependent oxidoreductase [Bacteroidales bacterium]